MHAGPLCIDADAGPSRGPRGPVSAAGVPVRGGAGPDGTAAASGSAVWRSPRLSRESGRKETGQHDQTDLWLHWKLLHANREWGAASTGIDLSADIDYPRRLEAARQAEPGSLNEYATGCIVLWTRNDSGIDVRRRGLRVVADGSVRRIAIANPEHAPYGRAAVAALRHEGLYEQVQGKLVLGENISQAAQFAQSGSAEIGVLALSLALSPALKSSGTYAEISDSWYPVIEQAAIVLASSRLKPAARRSSTT